MKTNAQQGFIALMSVIIILAVLLVITTSLSFTSFSSRFNVSDAEYKKRSSGLAEACVSQALLKLAQNPSYVGGETIPVGSDSCVIFSVAAFGGQTAIETKGIFQQSVTNLKVTVNTASLSFVSWEELPSL